MTLFILRRINICGLCRRQEAAFLFQQVIFAMSAVLPTYARYELMFDHGKGAYIFTKDGKRYLDFSGGVAVNSLGHAHPHLVSALKAQAEKLWHTSNLYKIEGQERLAERLAGASFADVVFFSNSGAEAVECAIKMARKYQSTVGAPERFRLITFENAFHGRTLATIAAGGQEMHLEGFGPAVDGFDKVAAFDIDMVRAAIGPETAGILIEPVQGEGGVRVVPSRFLKDLREIADVHGLLLIFDEVQTGVGRTGQLYAYENSDIAPDILASAKGLGGGFPVGACLATSEAAKGMVFGSHGSTFGGNPLAMAVGNAVLDIVLGDGFLEDVRHKALLLKQKLAGLGDEFPDVIEEIRGAGLLVGIKVKPPVGDVVSAIIAEGLLVVPAGDNVVRLLPPLNASVNELDEAVQCMERALSRLMSNNTQSKN